MRLARPELVLTALAFAACDGSAGAPTGQPAPDTVDTLADAAPDTAPPDAAPDAPGDAADPSALDPRCASILADCVQRQRTCVVEDGEATCRACGPGEYPTHGDGRCTPLGGVRIAHDFGEQTLASGEEIGSLCQTWILDNDEELWVNAVEMDNDGAYHHSNWFFVPEDYNGWPTTPWRNCYREGFNEVAAAVAGGVLYAQSTQVKHELQKFQDGAAVHIPPRSRIITVTHLLNYQVEPVTTGLRVALYTLPRADVKIPLTPAQFGYVDLRIPPEAQSWFRGDCDLASTYADLFDGQPLAMKVHYILPHYHALGAGFEVSIIGGPRDGELILDGGAFSTDPFGFTYDPPIDLAGATGLHFGCKYDNPRSEVVGWGIGDQEMCEALLFLESPMAFTAGVRDTSSQTSEGDLSVFTGECAVAAFPFDPMD